MSSGCGKLSHELVLWSVAGLWPGEATVATGLVARPGEAKARAESLRQVQTRLPRAELSESSGPELATATAKLKAVLLSCSHPGRHYRAAIVVGLQAISSAVDGDR